MVNIHICQPSLRRCWKLEEEDFLEDLQKKIFSYHPIASCEYPRGRMRLLLHCRSFLEASQGELGISRKLSHEKFRLFRSSLDTEQLGCSCKKSSIRCNTNERGLTATERNERKKQPLTFKRVHSSSQLDFLRRSFHLPSVSSDLPFHVASSEDSYYLHQL